MHKKHIMIGTSSGNMRTHSHQAVRGARATAKARQERRRWVPRVGALLLALQARGGSALQLPTLSPLAIDLSPAHTAASVCIFAAGDLVSQQIERRDSAPHCAAPPLSRGVQRTVSAAALGSVYGGLMLPFVYQLAEGLFPGVSLLKVAAKVLLSCSLLSTIGNWFSLMWRQVAQPTPRPGERLGARLLRCRNSVNAEMPSVFLHDLRVWPAYDVITFAAIPPPLRPFTCAVVSVCWAVYISYVAAAAERRRSPSLQPAGQA